MNDIKLFTNGELGIQVRTILNEDGSISINAEDTARGFGWIKTEKKGGKDYTSIRWERMNVFSAECGFAHEWSKDEYIPESLFYMLGMKAGNERALKYQKWLAMDVLPSLRKTGTYKIPNREPKSRKVPLSSVNNTVKFMAKLYQDAGVDPSFIAIAAGKVYKEAAGLNFDIPITTPEEHLYDKTTMAEMMGIYSEKGNPHALYIGAVMSYLAITPDEVVNAPFTRNGHSDIGKMYKQSVYDKVQAWIVENNYPKTVRSNETGRNIKAKFTLPVIK